MRMWIMASTEGAAIVEGFFLCSKVLPLLQNY